MNEVPLAGISDGGRMYVFVGTDNPVYPPGPTQSHFGFATRSVVGVSDDDGQTFHYLFDFSKGHAAMVDDIYPGAIGSEPASLMPISGTMFFTAIDGVNGRELWQTPFSLFLPLVVR